MNIVGGYWGLCKSVVAFCVFVLLFCFLGGFRGGGFSTFDNLIYLVVILEHLKALDNTITEKLWLKVHSKCLKAFFTGLIHNKHASWVAYFPWCNCNNNNNKMVKSFYLKSFVYNH